MSENLPVRITFSKTGRAKYISHLDLYRAFQRAVRRAKLPLWETEGFNKHVFLTFALPLSLGHESICEVLDVKIKADGCHSFSELAARLNAALPEGLRVISFASPVKKVVDIAFAKYVVTTETVVSEKQLSDYLAQDNIIVTKITKKKGEQRIDLKPLIQAMPLDSDLQLIVPAGSGLNINPNLVLESLFAFLKLDLPVTRCRILRTGILTADKEIFM